jgi:pyrimidine-nucleoside phosphorylase
MSEAFSMYQLIDQKKFGQELSDRAIKWVIEEYTKKNIPDYQIAAWLMTIRLKGMSVKETAALTDAMLYSGRVLTFNDPAVVDKHSTGGIGDKASFILAPVAACLGVKVPMIAGRSLGFTGGTIDKIEAIPGFKVNLSLDEFSKLLIENGLVLIGQTPEIAPADRLIYALRDVTATIDSVPLITASIMSKKLAEGANGLVLDIKFGSGAFMRKASDARVLAKSLLGTAKRFKKKGVAVLSSMNQPLGEKVGHSLELLESIETLQGKGPKDLTTLSLTLAAHMALIGGKAKSFKQAYALAEKTLKDGSALKKFAHMVKAQGGDDSFIFSPDKLVISKEKMIIQSPKSGWIKSFQNDLLGMLLIDLGGGRKTKEDKIDLSVGFHVHAKIGDKVKKGDPLLTIYHHTKQKEQVQQIGHTFLNQVLSFSTRAVKAEKTILETLKG